MRRLCLIIFVIPAAAAGFDVPAVDLNRERFPSHPPSASQPGRRQRQQRLHTPLGHTHANLLTQGYFPSEKKSLKCQCSHRSCVYKLTVTPTPLQRFPVKAIECWRCGSLNWQKLHQRVICLMGTGPPWPVWC